MKKNLKWIFIGMLVGQLSFFLPAIIVDVLQKSRAAMIAGPDEAFLRAVKIVDPASGKEMANGVYVAENVVLTNWHVCNILNEIGTIAVVDYKKDAYRVSSAIAEESMTDSCLMGVAAMKIDELGTLLVDSAPVRLGQQVEIHGYSYRHTDYMVYSGHIGTVLEVVNYNITQNDPLEKVAQYYQGDIYFDRTIKINIPVIPGCSGSGLYDSSGALIGLVNASTRAFGQVVGLAVRMQEVAAFLKRHGIPVIDKNPDA